MPEQFQVAAGGSFSLKLNLDGTVIHWGYGGLGISDVPAGLNDAEYIAAGTLHCLALRTDGTLVAWGYDSAGQATAPAGLSNVTGIAAGQDHSVACKNDGSVVSWGSGIYSLTTVPAEATGVIAVAAGRYHCLALRDDGTVVAWGRDEEGQATVPAGLTDVVKIACGRYHSLALKSDGTVIGWGADEDGQATPPAGLSGVVAISGGTNGDHSLALKADGTVVTWGNNSDGQDVVPAGLTGVIGIASGSGHNLAVKADGTVIGWGDNSSGQLDEPVIGSLSLPIEVKVGPSGSAPLPLPITVYDASKFPGHGGTVSGGTFSVYVEIGGQDYTDRLIGSVEVDAEEGAARVATLSVVLPEGSFQPDDWINLPVFIDYLDEGLPFRIFTGIVDLPELSLTDDSVVLSCTDDLQSRFEDQPRSAIESLFSGTGAKWSPAVFGEFETSGRFAEDLLSTVPASADLDRNGQLKFGEWHSIGYDFLFQDSEVFPESVAVEWGSRRDIITKVNIDADYTYQFFRERSHRYSWEYGRTFAQYLEVNSTLPTSSMIEQAASGSGWEITSKALYQRLPESGEYSLPGGGTTNWVISDDLRLSLALGADFEISKRWIQDVKESYQITVQSSPNIARFGLLSRDIRVSLDTSDDESGFEDFEYEPDVAAETIGSDSAWPTFESSSMQVALETAVAQASVMIQDSMRQNSVSFTTLIQPELERFHHIRIESNKVTAEGKTARIRHIIDLDDGSATTDIVLAISRGEDSAGSSLSYQGLSYSEDEVGTFTQLDTALQDFSGQVESPGEFFQGYVGNYVSQLNNVPNPFEERFAILAPEISAQSRDSVEYSEAVLVEAATYNQTLTVNL